MDAMKSRPLSPHLQVYKLIPTMAMSIVHRITGGALYFGTLLATWWLFSAAVGENYFNIANWFFGTIIGQIILCLYTWALVHHMLGGMRYLVWDTTHAMQKVTATRLAQANLVGSIALTIVIWLVGYLVVR